MKNLNPETQKYLTEELEFEPREIAEDSADELLDAVLTYEGYGMSAGYAIRNWIKKIYGIDLSETSAKIFKREIGEM